MTTPFLSLKVKKKITINFLNIFDAAIGLIVLELFRFENFLVGHAPRPPSMKNPGYGPDFWQGLASHWYLLRPEILYATAQICHCDFWVSFSNGLSFHSGFIALHLALLKRGSEHPVQNWWPFLQIIHARFFNFTAPCTPNVFTNNAQCFKFYIFAPWHHIDSIFMFA